VLLLAYSSGLIKVTQKLRLGIVAATGGIAVFYLLELVLGFFGVHFATINGNGLIGIGFSVVVVIAALNLVLDFDFIETGVKVGAPKYMEWYGAFGIMVTLVWLYLEILRLLSCRRCAAGTKVLPACRVILFSGQASTADLLDRAQAEGYTFEVIAKPIHPKELLRMLHSPQS
jgi:hypothetical protein